MLFSVMSISSENLSLEKKGTLNAKATTETWEGKGHKNIEPIISHTPVLPLTYTDVLEHEEGPKYTSGL